MHRLYLCLMRAMEELKAMFPTMDGEVITAVLRETRNDGKGNRWGERLEGSPIRFVSHPL